MRSTRGPAFVPAGKRVTAVASLWLALGACSTAGTEAPPPVAFNRDLSDVLYEPGTNDEGLLVLLDAPPVGMAAREPAITSPEDGTVLSGPTLVIYCAGATTGLLRRPRARLDAWHHLLELFALERTAEAHGAPMNGDAYFITFATEEDATLLRVFTRDTVFAAAGDLWQRLSTATGAVTLRVTRGTFEEGRLTADGGPYVSNPVYVTIAR